MLLALLAAASVVSAHVADVAGSLAPHVRAPLAVTVVDKSAALGRASGGTLEISTGLLAALESDAQLAAVLGYEAARAGGASDEAAAGEGLRAAVAAGWDGRVAAGTWRRLAAATLLGDEGGYGDARANQRRTRAATRALRASGQRATAKAGYAVGADSYREHVLSHLRGGRLAEEPGREAPAPSVPATGTADAPWLVYRRSGGFTGWSAEMRIGTAGSRWTSESQRKSEAGPKAPVPAERMAELRRLVALVASRPPRVATPQAKWLRDGMLRSIEVPDERGTWKSVSLSDGLELSDDDHALVTLLEDLLR